MQPPGALGAHAPNGVPSASTSVSITGSAAPPSTSTSANTVANPRPASEYPGIALIVGAGSRESSTVEGKYSLTPGLGRTIALWLLRQGCTKFILTDPSPDALNHTSYTLKQVAAATDLYTTAFVLPGHYTEDDFAQRLLGEITKWFGRVDYAVNIWSDPPASVAVADGHAQNQREAPRFSTVANGMDLDVSLDAATVSAGTGSAETEWDTLARGLKGFYELSRKELGLMKSQQVRLREAYVGRKQRASVVHVVPEVSSIASLTTTDAKAYSEHLVRINAVLTGPMEDPDIPIEVRQMLVGGKATVEAGPRGLGGRLRTVDEVADTIVWLLGEKSSFVHGQVFGR